MNKRLTLTIVLLALITLMYGCSGKTTHKVLSFFFDGVPTGEETKSAGGKEKGKEISLQKTSYREHGPYAAKLCQGCHLRGGNELVMPLQELCFKCHELNIKKKKIHGPLASGGCTVCHSPHGSAYPFLLVAEPKVFCLYCHDKNDILKKEVHRDTEEQCTTCHDAHSSDNEYLLK